MHVSVISVQVTLFIGATTQKKIWPKVGVTPELGAHSEGQSQDGRYDVNLSVQNLLPPSALFLVQF